MARRAPKSKKAKSKAPAKPPRTRLQRRNEQLVVRNIPVLPPTFRCWFCIGEKGLGEEVPHSRTLPICRKCQEHFTRVGSERDTDTHPAAAISGSASRSALPLSSFLSSSSPSHLPRPRHLGFPSHPLRPAVVIDSRKGLKKKMILRFKGPPKQPDGDPTSNERRQEKTEITRRRLPAPRLHPRPILFLSLPKPTGEDGGKILLRFRNPLRNKEWGMSWIELKVELSWVELSEWSGVNRCLGGRGEYMYSNVIRQYICCRERGKGDIWL